MSVERLAGDRISSLMKERRQERRANRRERRQERRENRREKRQEFNQGFANNFGDFNTSGSNNSGGFKGANWNNPSQADMDAFEKQHGYSQYLGGFRDKFRDDYMKDGVIDYYSDKRLYDRIYKKVGKNTGLTFNKVDNADDAEIVNYWSRKHSGDFTDWRTDKKTGKEYGVTYDGFEKRRKQEGIPKGYYIAGTSYANDVGALNDPFFKGIDDLHQTNLVNVQGSRYDRRLSAWHEVGHSLGLQGDDTLNKKDPSVMSYNNFRGNKFGRREYESIKRLHQGYF